MRERSSPVSAAPRSLGPWAGLELPERPPIALPAGRAEVGPSFRPDCPGKGAEASRGGASAWGTAERPPRTLSSGGSGELRYRMGAVVCGFPGVGSGAPGLRARTRARPRDLRRSHLGGGCGFGCTALTSLRCRLQGTPPTASDYRSGRGGTPGSKWGSHHCFSLSQEFSGNK